MIAQRGAPVHKGKGPWWRNIVMMIFLIILFSGKDKVKTREDKRMAKL